MSRTTQKKVENFDAKMQTRSLDDWVTSGYSQTKTYIYSIYSTLYIKENTNYNLDDKLTFPSFP